MLPLRRAVQCRLYMTRTELSLRQSRTSAVRFRQPWARTTNYRLISSSSTSKPTYISGRAKIILVVLSLATLYSTRPRQRTEGPSKSSLRNDSESDQSRWPTSKPSIDKSAVNDAETPHKELSGTAARHRDLVRDTARHSSRPPDEDAYSPWATFQSKFTAAQDTIASIKWASIPDTISDFVVPDWVRVLPDYLTKLQRELSMATGSLSDEIWDEAHDAGINPEIVRDAVVRISDSLCPEEVAFVRDRKQVARTALAKYLDIAEADINIDDVPTIAICGSGGGLRALVAGASSYLSAEEAGLFDCATYIAGVSGSCWLQALYYSSLGGRRFDRLVDHLKARIGVHIAFPPPALALLSTAPTNKFLLSGIVERLKGDPDVDVGLVDIYGLLLAARLMVPKGDLGINDADLKVSNQREYIDKGRNPLPIYTAVRHEIPPEDAISADEDSTAASAERIKKTAIEEAWFQWFEITPYELWCEELQAGIPTWATGRRFDKGRNVMGSNGAALPELRIPMLLGIWGSAFCATLSHYYREIRPVVKGLTGFGGLDELIEGRDDDLIRVHPITPASIPNYVLGLEGRLPATCPESIWRSSHLQLMDAGMSNNLPIYPLLRPGRDVDVLVAFDASADVKTDNWLAVADGYARQRGIKGWPIGVGWPRSDADHAANVEQLEAAQAASSSDATAKLAGAKDDQQAQRQRSSGDAAELGYCTVWVGSTEERSADGEPPRSKRMDGDWKQLDDDAGITLIYFPFMANDKVEGVDPMKSDFMSTWNFVYTPDDIDKVVALARANFEEGKEQTKAAVRAVYERKKKIRERREWQDKMDRRRRKTRLGLVGKIGEGDHFS
ncbi:MAG: hypothetical protein M1825_004493 [Sarcosagium campestre]|nr:MAG: hypothetical protein M1825_004493 [Sarcosagium campestre]